MRIAHPVRMPMVSSEDEHCNSDQYPKSEYNILFFYFYFLFFEWYTINIYHYYTKNKILYSDFGFFYTIIQNKLNDKNLMH